MNLTARLFSSPLSVVKFNKTVVEPCCRPYVNIVQYGRSVCSTVCFGSVVCQLISVNNVRIFSKRTVRERARLDDGERRIGLMITGVY